MRRNTCQGYALLAATTLLLFAQIGLRPLNAQTPSPASPDAATVTSPDTPIDGTAAPQTPAETAPPSFEIRRPPAESAPSAPPAEPAPALEESERVIESIDPDSASKQISAGSTEPARNGIAMASSSVNAVMSADAEVAPASLHAGETLTYTFTYTNTSGGTQNNVIALVTWTRMGAVENQAEWERTQMQFCANDCAPVSISGPAVTKGPTDGSGNNVQYQIASLQAGQTGRFSVVLKARRNQYPRTGAAPNRPAASVQMYADNNFAVKLAEDTVNSLITGPVLSINKLVAPAWLRRVTIDEPMEFQIGIGNTTAAGDIIDNQPRADAEAATNLVFADRFPVGADYVPTSNDPPGVTRFVDVPNRIISWTVSALAPRQAMTVTARFKKNLDPAGCDAIANINYQATSSEFPLNYTGLPYKEPENPPRIAVDVVPSIKVADLVLADPSITFGDETTATIVVHSYYSQTITGAQLEFKPHAKIAYVPGSGNPAPSVAPTGISFGGQVLWDFDIAPGFPMTPTVMSFTMRLRGAFQQALFDQAQMRVLVPSEVNNTCMGWYQEYVSVMPRLEVFINRSPWAMRF